MDKITWRGKMYYHHVDNILRLFDGLANFPFTASEQSMIISNKLVIYELAHELPNDLKLRILGN